MAKSSNKAATEKKKKKYVNPMGEEVNHRCYGKFLRETMKEVRLSAQHLSLLYKTPFHPFLEMPDIHCEGHLVEKICRCYVADDKFVFAGITCTFSKEEVALITGLPFHGKAIDLKSKKTSDFWLLNKHFPESKALRRRDLKSKLIELCKSKEEEDIQDFVRILIFHMCSTFLLPNKGYACPSNVTKYVDDLEATWDFSWASAVHDMLMEDLRLFSQRIRRRDAGEVGVSLGYISGCTAALMVWFYEHSRMRKPSAYGLFPRMVRWVRSEDKSPLVRLSEKFHLLTAEQVYPELLIRQDEEHLFRPHEAKLIADKFNMKAIEKGRMEEDHESGPWLFRPQFTEINRLFAKWGQRSSRRALHSVNGTSGDVSVI
ncbi:hypothetical protein QJS10_CPB20g00908 [Acorus calamus]|uniref:DUF1985 domain-containing protein n=1 Tax=Acorus calamus TaxID=4465 RepID=A0AAV9CDL9_ACOCL|nr:hypothetical protein QJS10_CPB20g00908 [Acorus calamus]